MATSILTVNVMLFTSNNATAILRMKSWPESEEGNKEAEQTFQEWTGLSDEDLSDALDEGYYEKPSGTIVIITHSTEPTESEEQND